jgi:hypothetical protein
LISGLLGRINRTRRAEGETFLVHYDLAELAFPARLFQKLGFGE